MKKQVILEVTTEDNDIAKKIKQILKRKGFKIISSNAFILNDKADLEKLKFAESSLFNAISLFVKRFSKAPDDNKINVIDRTLILLCDQRNNIYKSNSALTIAFTTLFEASMGEIFDSSFAGDLLGRIDDQTDLEKMQDICAVWLSDKFIKGDLKK